MTENAPENETEVDEIDDDTTEQDGVEDLGDKGKQALDRMKADRNAARKEARDLKARLEALEQRSKPGGDDAIEAARREATAEATKSANQRILRTEVRAVATGKLADPSDALAYLDLSDFEVDEDGEVDTDAISEAVADLLSKKPYLAAKRFQGDGDMGKGKQKQAPKPPSQNDLLRAAIRN